MAQGYQSTADILVSNGIDLELLRRETLRGGATVGDYVALFALGLDAYNSEFSLGLQKIGTVIGLLSGPTAQREVRKSLGSHARGINVEYVEADPQKVGATSWLIGDHVLDQRIGATWQFLKNAAPRDIRENITAMFAALRDSERYYFLTRLFRAADEAVGSGLSIGVMGNSSLDPAFYPPAWNGVSFDDTHTHLFRKADSADGIRAFFRDGYKTLREHGLESGQMEPLVLLHSPEDLDDIQEDAQYEAASDSQWWINYGATERSQVGDLATVAHGVIKDIGAVCIDIGGIPTKYMALVKSFGLNNDSNPVARYFDDLDGDRAIPTDINAGVAPRQVLTDLGVTKTTGYGMYNPVGAALCLLAAEGNYVDPTIS
jgi:hypothetical protein